MLETKDESGHLGGIIGRHHRSRFVATSVKTTPKWPEMRHLSGAIKPDVRRFKTCKDSLGGVVFRDVVVSVI